jgi:hypothetical protein
VYDVGDVLYTRVTITSTGSTNALNVTFQDNFAGSTLVNNTLNISPIAFNDTFQAIGNTVLRVGATDAGTATINGGESKFVVGNLMSNDVASLAADSVKGMQIDVVTNGVSVNGGTFNIFSDGSFNYVNDGTDTTLANDTFTYTIRDAGLDGTIGNADDLTSTATVTITFALQSAGGPAHRVWYVDGSASPGGDGTSAKPFQNLSQLNGVGGAGDRDEAGEIIYVEGTVSGPLALESGQQLIGDGADLIVAGTTLATAGTNSTLAGAAGQTTVVLSTNNIIAGIDIGSGSGTGNGISGSNFGTLTVNNATINSAGQALDLTNGTFAGSGFTSTSSDGGSMNVSLVNVTGTVALGTGALAGAGTHAINIANTSGAPVNTGLTYGGTVTHSGTGGLLNVAGGVQGHTGTVALTGAVTASGTSTGLQFTNADGTYSVNSGAASSLTGSAGIDIVSNTAGNSAQGSAGTFTFGDMLSINSSGSAVVVSDSTATINFSADVTQASNFAALDVTNHASGVFTFQTTSNWNVTNGTGLQFSNADGTYTMSSANVLNGGDAGIDIDTGSSGNFAFISNTSITNPSGDAFVVDNSTATISFGGSITDNSGRVVNINEHDSANGITFTTTSSITATAGSSGILIQNSNAGGTIAFNGQVQLTTTTQNAVTLIGNTLKTVTFNADDLGLDIVTTTGKGFSATGGGTVNVLGSGNTVSSAGGIAVEVQNTTIGGMTFLSVSANGGTNGILLNNSGTGAFTVTGTDGADAGTAADAGTGGTIQNTTLDAVSLVNASNVSLNGINITNGDGDGINMNGGSGLTLVTVTMNSAGSGDNDHGIQLNNVGGTVSIQGSSFTGPEEDFIHVDNNNTNLTLNVGNVTANTFTQGTVGTFSGNGIVMTGRGTTNFNLNVSNNTFTNVKLFGIQVGGDATWAGNNNNLTIHDNDFIVNVGNTLGSANNRTNAINIQGRGTADIDATVSLNTLNGGGGGGIQFGADESSNVSGIIQSNTISNQFADGILAAVDESATLTLLIDSNTITNTSSDGMEIANAISPDGKAATLNVTITNNVVNGHNNNAGANAFAGGIVVVGGADALDNTRVDIRNNTVSGNPNPGTFFDYWIDGGSFGDAIEMKGPGVGMVTEASFLAQPNTANAPAGGKTYIANTFYNNNAAIPQPVMTPMEAASAPPAIAEEPEPIDGGLVGNPEVDNGEEAPAPAQPSEPAPAPDAAPTQAQPVVVDDGILSPAELDLIVEAAIQRWAAAGATDEQIAAMRTVSFTVSDLGGLVLGSSGLGTITLDNDAAGWRWFVDETPNDDSEYAGAGTKLSAADRNSLAGTRIDLLTVVTHELGHQIGLSDTYAPGETDELMFGTVGAGERRLPGSDDAASASGSAVAGAFAISPINLGTLEPGKIVVIEWRHTVDAQGEDMLAGYVGGQSIVTYEGGEVSPDTVLSNAEGQEADSLSFGNLVFLDVNKNGVFDGTDTGIAGVTLSLYADTNNSGHFDDGDLAVVFADNNGNGIYDPGTDDPLAPGTEGSDGVDVVQLTATTDANGLYSFAGLAPGDYIAVFDDSNFDVGGPLHTRVVGVGGKNPNDTNADNDADTAAPADLNVDNDNNGEVSSGATATRAVRLDYGQEPGGDVNNSVDVAFVQPNQAPSGADAAIAINEDIARTLTVADFGYTDADGNALLEILVNSVSGGTLTVNGTAVTTFPATITPTQLNGNQVVFTPTANANGSGAGSIAFQVRDNGGTDNGGIDTDQSANTLTFNIAAVNDAPNLDPGANVVVNEDAGAVSIPAWATNINAGPANESGQGLTVTTTVLSGDLAFTTAPAVNVVTGNLTFQTAANDFGTATVQVTVTDDNGTPGNTADDLSEVHTFTITANSVNDAPVLSQTPASEATFTEGQAGSGAALLQGGQVFDADAANFAGGSLTVSVSGTGNSLSLPNADGFAGQPNSLFYQGTKIADLAATASTITLTNFTAAMTPAVLNLLLDNFRYIATGDNPNTADRTVTFTLNDGGNSGDGGAQTGFITQTINVVAVNDAPSGADNSKTISEDGSYTFAAADFGFTDALDSNAFSGVVVTTLPTNGTLVLQYVTPMGPNMPPSVMTFPVAAGQTVSANDINAGRLVFHADPNENGAPYATFTFQVQDNGGTDNGGQNTDQTANTFTINVTAVNDAPVLDLNGAAAGDSASGTATEQVAAGTGPLASAATVTDVDSANFDTGTLTVSITANAQVGDILSVQNYSDGSGNALTAAEGTIAYNGTVVATFTAGDHDTPLVVTFDADATAAAVQFVTRAVYLAHTGDAPSASVRTLTYTLTDGDGGSDSATATVTVSPDNDAPDLTAPTNATITYTEGAASVALMGGVTLSDIDLPANFAGGSLTIAVSGVGGGINLRAGSNFVINNNGDGTHSLAFVDGQTQIAIGTISGFGTSSLTVSNFAVGATLARLNDLVDDFTYLNLNNNPGSADRTVTMTFNDGNNTGSGADVALTDTVTQTLQITPVNDAPFNSLGATITTSEDATDVWLSGMSISDPDADPANDIVYVTFQVTNGSIKIRTDVTGGIVADDIVGIATDTISVATTLNKINATLAADNGLTYTPAANFNGNATLTVQSNDGGANGVDPGLSGEPTNEEDVDTRTIEVTAINDAPTSANDSITTSEDDAYTLTAADFPISDIDGNTLSAVRITGLPTGGTLRLGNDAVTDEQVISVADINAGLLTYTPNADQIGSPHDSFKFTVIDNGGTANGGANESGEQTMTVNVTPDNLAPVVDLNSNTAGVDYFEGTYSEGGAGASIGSGITVTDPDSGNGDLIEGATVTISDAQTGDQLTISGNLPAGITVDPTSTATVLKLTGAASQADYQTALAQVRYSHTGEDPTVGQTDLQRTIVVTVTDGAATSAPASATISIAAENDAPTNTVPAAVQTVTEDQNHVFSTATGNAISIADPDAESSQPDVTVTLSVLNGRLTLATQEGLTSVSNDGTASVTLTGTVAEINAALDGLVYRGNLNFEGDDTLTILTNDNGWSGTGGAKTDQDEVRIEVKDDGFINGDTGNNVLNGTPNRDFFLVQQGGDDTVNGLGGRDVIYFGDAFTSADIVNGGGQSDIVILQGNYLAQTSIGSITNLGELGSISLFSSNNNLYGGATAGLNNYNLVATNDTVAASQTLKINGSGLQVDEDVTFDGSAELDGSFQIYGGRGTDQLTGGAMGDNFVFVSGTWDSSDRVTGGTGYDVLYLRGNYNFTFGATQLSGIESIGLLSATEKVFASGGGEFDYTIEWNDAVLDAGQTIVVNGSRLTAEENMNFNGSSETAGNFRLFGGMSNDVLTGGAGNDLIFGGLRGDTLTGGAGNDVFRYQSVLESNNVERDGIQDFTLGDKIDLSRIDTDPDAEGDQAFTFIGGAEFSGVKGELRFKNISNGGTVWEVQGDVNGDGVADLEIVVVVSDMDPITIGDFLL